MRNIILSLFIILILPIASYSQTPISDQGWQTVTISGDTITVDCADFVVPYTKGDLLDEPNPVTVRGEFDETLRSPFPVKIAISPESGTADNISTISGCTINGARIEMRSATVGNTITVLDSAAGLSGSQQFPGDVNIVLSDPASIRVIEYVGTANAWMIYGGGGSSLEGNLVLTDGQLIDANSGMTFDSANEGVAIGGSTSCSFAATRDGLLCRDTDDVELCWGTGSGIQCISGGQCSDSQACFGNIITGIDTSPFIMYADNDDGFVARKTGSGLEFGCFEDISGAMTPCKPPEIVSMAFSRCTADESQAFRAFDVSLSNGEVAEVGYTISDDDTGAGGVIRCHFPINERFDGTNLQIGAFVDSQETTPAGDINLDWVGYCTSYDSTINTTNYPSADSNSEMVIDLDALSGTNRMATGETVGNIPLSGCTTAGPKILWLEATVDETSTTADNLTQQIIFDFIARYGISANTDGELN